MRPQSLNALGHVSGIPTILPKEIEVEPGLEREGLYFLLLLFLVNITKWTCKLYAGVVKPFLSDLL